MNVRSQIALFGILALLGCASTGTGGETGTGGGGQASGGTTGQGGSATGGTTASGGATGTGGGVGTGGVNANGGATGSGGTPATGGTTGTGGAKGGSTGAGGAGGRATGGTTGTGGATGQGGSTGTGTGGTTATGGAGGVSCPGSAYDSSNPPQALTLTGSLGAHDPAAYVLGSTIYLAATGLIAKTSTNLTTWNNAPTPLALPAWAATATGATNLWAPDISFFGGVYHLYYAASTFGKNVSCIGQATRADLASGSWADQGQVLCSNIGETDNWNAIDPNVVIDDAGTPWLEFGSFWSGLKMVKLDPSTGLRADTMLYALANGASSKGSLEGGWIFKRCGYYYLFSSWGACCSGAYDYNIRVGRGTTVTGPYVDEAGTDLMKGGGTLLVQGNTDWVAPGHNAVIVYNNKTYNLYHALKGSSSGAATLRISEIAWTADGWPVSGGP
ncbi:MAG TPA: arabinan endo-1,5-alpha-L-arabinosidase [Polyangia bacterium]|jgi:arabinan endo-1,5-alpha-L-arabinosidase|nr:arabinan endo-1,5-alpha-L-arabinosidase [Polyangia bacterium]